MDDNKKPKKIDIITASVMVVIALAFDLLSLIPIVSILTGFTAWLIFLVWFYLLGFDPFEKRRLGVAMSSFVLEIFPIISILPLITAGLITNIIMINKEVSKRVVK